MKAKNSKDGYLKQNVSFDDIIKASVAGNPKPKPKKKKAVKK